MVINKLIETLNEQNDIINDINTLLQNLVALNEATLVQIEKEIRDATE